MNLGELARRLGAQLEGDAGLEIGGIAALADAGPGDLSLLSDLRMLEIARQSKAAALLVPGDFDATQLGRSAPLLRHPRPDLALADAILALRPPWRPGPGVDATARIDPTARLGRDCHVGAYVVIGAGCQVGDEAVLHPHAVLYPDVRAGDRFTAHAHAVVREGTRLGHDVTLQPGAVVGSDGFGFARQADGTYRKIPQVGHVVIGDGAELQANSCVDRATLGATKIGAGTKLDNLAHVAHNCELGDNVLLCAQAGLAGSTRLEDGVILAGQVGVAGHCTIGRNAIVTAQSGTHGDLAAGEMYSGSPAFSHAQWLRATAVFARLPELQKSVREIRRKIGL